MQRKREKHIAFSVSGGCYPYQMGIAYYLQKNFNLDNIKFSGSSGGSWPAVLLAANADIKLAIQYIVDIAAPLCKGRLLGAYGIYSEGMKAVYNKLFENVYVPDVVRGKLTVSVTRLALSDRYIPFLKDEHISEFIDNEDVILAVIGSSLIPFAVTGAPFLIYRNWICVDAGLTNVAGVRRFHDLLLDASDVGATSEEKYEEVDIEQGTVSDADEMINGKNISEIPMTLQPYGVGNLSIITTKAVLSSFFNMVNSFMRSPQELSQSSPPVPDEEKKPSKKRSRIELTNETSESADFGNRKRIYSSWSDDLTALRTAEKNKSTYSQLWNVIAGSKEPAKVSETVNSESSGTVFDTLMFPVYQSINFVSKLTRFSLFSDSESSNSNVASSNILNYIYRITSELKSLTSGQTNEVLSGETACSRSVTGDSHDNEFIRSADGMISYLYGKKPAESSDAVKDIESGREIVEESKEEDCLKISNSVTCKESGDPVVNNVSETSDKEIVAVSNDEIVVSEETDIKSDAVLQQEFSFNHKVKQFDKSMYWINKADLVTQTSQVGPDGKVTTALVMEISPWVWRHHPLHHFHLSSSEEQLEMLFELGIHDAHHHRSQLQEFFDADFC